MLTQHSFQPHLLKEKSCYLNAAMDLLILLLPLLVPVVKGQTTHEILVTYHSYANPSGRCIDCGGGTAPGCCDVSTPVPQDQSCRPEVCDTALTYCFRSLGSTSTCTLTENQQSLAPQVLLDSRSTVFNSNFFGLLNPARYISSHPWQGQLQILYIFHECMQNLTCIVDFDTVIDRIPINFRAIVGVPIPETTYNGTAGIAYLTASIVVRCVSGYYGRDCTTLCSDFMSCAGCGLSGFTGQFCQFGVEECSDVYCNGNGNCREGSSLCNCVPGFTGNRCETDFDECVGMDCSNNGQCVDEVNGFRCQCNAGFTGELCDIIDYCEGIDCSNGTCMNKINNFRCDCDIGFTGDLCDLVDYCEGIDCNNGTCMNEINDFRCDCDIGFTGRHCDIDINDCEGVDCNYGTCEDLVNDFRCDCDLGFTGAECNVNINDCEGVDCGSGTCADQVNSFRCDCISGFTGEQCQDASALMADIVPIVGSAVGALVGALTFSIITVIVIVVVVKAKRLKRLKFTEGLDDEEMTDNPSYNAWISEQNDTLQGSNEYHEVVLVQTRKESHKPAVTKDHVADTTLQEREFKNPIYGSGVVERDFKNPIYTADDHSKAQPREQEGHYAVPRSLPSNVYEEVAKDQPVDDSDTEGGVYSTVKAT